MRAVLILGLLAAILAACSDDSTPEEDWAKAMAAALVVVQADVLRIESGRVSLERVCEDMTTHLQTVRDLPPPAGANASLIVADGKIREAMVLFQAGCGDAFRGATGSASLAQKFRLGAAKMEEAHAVLRGAR